MMKRSILRVLSLLLLLCLLPAAALGERSYLIPDSDTRELTRDELWQWDYESLGYILNELFARHGYNFIPGEKYDYYFRCMPWYTPNANPNNQEACYPQRGMGQRAAHQGRPRRDARPWHPEQRRSVRVGLLLHRL